MNNDPFMVSPADLDTDEIRIACMREKLKNDVFEMVVRGRTQERLQIPIPRDTGDEALAAFQKELENEGWEVRKVDTGIDFSRGTALSLTRPK